MNLGDLENRGCIWPALVRDLRYETPAMRVGWGLRNLPGLATFKYHLGVCSVIRGVSRKAADGEFGTFEFSKCCQDIRRLAESCGGKIHLEGVEHVRDSVPAVFVANHMSAFETLVMAGFILPFGDATFVLKESLLNYPVFKHLIRGIRPVAVGRTNPRGDLKTVLTVGVEKLKAGVSIILFPQATRSAVFNVDKVNSLGAKLAARAGVPMVPLALKTDFLAAGRIHKDFGRVHPDRPIRFRFGPPVCASSDPREAHRRAVGFIADCLEEWGLPVERAAGGVSVE